ncbi:ribonuclease P protein component [Nonlabens tegetincola]|uniref:Ribonuclease P protein component n=1 Tax=Nonlabens tegetincola TaxID=323273 RepID=A0A090Q2E5_9FLAO|nr:MULTISPECIES: ribonuclease P protein component [Nonlabens]GAK95888.1 ribonuclease P protein component [Nonlabens tegetincola]
MIRFTFSKNQKLKSRKLIEQLFKDGKSIKSGPLRLVYLPVEKETQIGVSVSKRYFKKAVDRNRLKRLLREAYRLSQHDFPFDKQPIAGMFIYHSNRMPEYTFLENQMKKLIKKYHLSNTNSK